MYQLTYTCDTTDHEGKPLHRVETIVVESVNSGMALIRQWNVQGKATGHKYGAIESKRYTGSLELNWVGDSIRFARLKPVART